MVCETRASAAKSKASPSKTEAKASTTKSKASITKTTVTAKSKASTARALSPSPQPSNLDTFHLFPQLPIELRHTIWDEACCVSRVVDLESWPLTGDGGYGGIGDALFDSFRQVAFVISTGSGHPPILHTSREARLVGLKHYKLDLGTEYRIDKMVGDQGMVHIDIKVDPRIYLNWNYDTMCILQGSQYDYGSTAVATRALVEYFHDRPLFRFAVCIGLVRDLMDELSFMLARQNGTEVIVYNSSGECEKLQLDPVLDCDRNFPIVCPYRQRELRHLYALHFTSGVPLYTRFENKSLGTQSNGTDFGHLNKLIKLLEDKVDKIRTSKPELNDLSPPTFKPMALISAGGMGIPKLERRIAELSKASSKV